MLLQHMTLPPVAYASTRLIYPVESKRGCRGANHLLIDDMSPDRAIFVDKKSVIRRISVSLMRGDHHSYRTIPPSIYPTKRITH
jgi:hypothetical protein